MRFKGPLLHAEAEMAAVERAIADDARALHARIAITLVLAVAYGAYVGLGPAALWASAYLSVQMLKKVTISDQEITPGRADAMVAMTAISSAVFGSVILVTPFVDGPWGVACGGWMLAGIMSYTVVAYMGARRLFYAALLPYVTLGVIFAFEARMVGAPWRNVVAMLLACLLGGGVAIFLWRAANLARAAELEALKESERRRIDAESAVAAKSAFIAVVSHELRTPISAMMAGSADLQRSLSGADAGKARLIADAGAMMRTLLNDLLDKAKMDAGKMSVEVAPYDLRTIVADQAQFWRAEAKRKGLRLKLKGAAGLPRWVMGDSIRLRQILNNLLSNAIKFTETGAVRLEITAAEAGGACRLAFTVRDTGPGLSEDAQARLFRAFEQAGDRKYGGTGLGLAISRDLARLMGGDLTVVSALGEGAAFTLTLTLPLAETPADPAANDAGAADLPPLRVLIVDDHEVNRRATALILEPFGARVTHAASGLEALTLLDREGFDVVLMDCFMPGLDGRQTTRELRDSDGPNHLTPVIAVTGSTGEDDIVACHEAGMNGHVPKPLTAANLIGAILQVIDHDPDGRAVA